MKRFMFILLVAQGCFWANVPGTIAHDRKEAREAAAAREAIGEPLEAAVNAARDRYYTCVETYAHDHAKSVALAGEIADAAASACHSQFSAFSVALSDRLEVIASGYPRISADAAAELRNMVSRTAAETVASVTEQGRQRAIRAVIEARPLS